MVKKGEVFPYLTENEWEERQLKRRKAIVEQV